MPATGGGRAVHAQPSKRSEKSKSIESMQAPRRESAQGAASATPAQRPGLKGRAYSTPVIPKNQEKGIAEDNVSLYSQDGEEIANDAFFQRYHFSQAVASTKEEAPERNVDSSSDTEGPMSPTHTKARTPAGGDAPSEPSSGVGCFLCPGFGFGLVVSSVSADNVCASRTATPTRHRPCWT
jgi:hypothetical protein